MVPDNNNQVGGFSGNSLWGSSPAIDVRRNQVYVGSGERATPRAYVDWRLPVLLDSKQGAATAGAHLALACEGGAVLMAPPQPLGWGIARLLLRLQPNQAVCCGLRAFLLAYREQL